MKPWIATHQLRLLACCCALFASMALSGCITADELFEDDQERWERRKGVVRTKGKDIRKPFADRPDPATCGN